MCFNNPTPHVRSVPNEKERCMGQTGKARSLGFIPVKMKLLLYYKPKSLWSFLKIILKLVLPTSKLDHSFYLWQECYVSILNYFCLFLLLVMYFS